MFVTYAPQDGDRQEFEFDPDKIRAVECELIEKRYGKTYVEWQSAVQAGSAKARRVLLWHLLRRTHHTLRYEDTPDFAFGELKVELSVVELLALRDRLKRADGLSAEDRDQIMAGLSMEIAEAAEREGLDEVPESAPKAG